MDRYKLIANLLLHPYDPAKNTPQDVGLGGLSTEYTSTSRAPGGGYMNYPRIWWDDAGEPHVLSDDDARAMAMYYQNATGRNFPAFDTQGAAEWSAMNRSAMGGAMRNRLDEVGDWRDLRKK